MARIDLAAVAARAADRKSNEATSAARLRDIHLAPQPGQDLASLRDIVVGSLMDECAESVARVESRITGESTRLREELTALERRVGERLATAETRVGRAHGELREHLLGETRILREAILEASAKAIRQVEEGVTSLDRIKLDRKAFSSLLSDLDPTQKPGPDAPAASTEELR